METTVDKTAEAVRRLRRERGLTQHEVAAIAGLSRQTIQNIEVGRREPGSATLRKLARALRVPASELL